MSRLLYGAAAAALTLAVVSAAGTAGAQSYNRLVVFGDSLSDNGNLYLATSGAAPASRSKRLLADGCGVISRSHGNVGTLAKVARSIAT